MEQTAAVAGALRDRDVIGGVRTMHRIFSRQTLADTSLVIGWDRQVDQCGGHMRWEYASISAINKHVLPEGSKSRREKCRSCVSTHSERARFLAECYV